MAQYWYTGTSGESPTGPFHADRDCDELDGESPRPIAEAVMADDAELCSCAPLSNDSEESGTCTVVKSDGEVCGRERPCPYHD